MLALLLALVVPVQPQVSVAAGVDVEVHVPTIQFAAEPPLVLVEPGVMVVPDHDREVFFVDGFYFCNVNGAWFRTRTHRGGWARVPTRKVPIAIVRAPRGKYRHFRGGKLVRRGGVVHHRPVVKARPKAKKRVATAKKSHARKQHASSSKKNKKPKKARVARSTRVRKLRSSHRTSARRHRGRH
jgi:hypothetical protein